MGKILWDNSSIARLPIKTNFLDKKDWYIQNYLYSLVLWDQIICIDGLMDHRRVTVRERNFWESVNQLSIDNINKKLGINYIIMDIDEYIEKSEEIVRNMEIGNEYFMIACDTIFYILLGFNLNVNICLSSERTKFFQQSHYDDYIFNRLDIINIVENKVNDFYKEINSKIGKKIICFQSPLLLDYICREATSFKEALKLALKIKQHKHVIKYRYAMDEIEKCLNNGNFMKLNEYLSIIPDIVDSIRNSEIKTQSFEIGLNPIPYISSDFNLKLKKPFNNKLHIHFLKDIAKFGMKERIYRI